jgi:hypothetical protein
VLILIQFNHILSQYIDWTTWQSVFDSLQGIGTVAQAVMFSTCVRNEPVRISPGIETVLTKDLHDFSQSLQPDVWIVPITWQRPLSTFFSTKLKIIVFWDVTAFSLVDIY